MKNKMPIEQLLQLMKQDWENDSTRNPELTQLINQYWDNSTMQEKYQLLVEYCHIIGLREEAIWSYERFCKEEESSLEFIANN